MAQCLTPYRLKEQDIDVPCGKCPACCLRRASGWSFRLMKEAEVSSSAFFVTLTYNTEHVPISENGFMTLSTPESYIYTDYVSRTDRTIRTKYKTHGNDLQNYFKRLRKHKLNKGEKLKYYAVGEYGSTYRRPHYHVILFNAVLETISESWVLHGKVIGDVMVQPCTGASVGYTLKYVSKPRYKPMHSNDDRVPEFSLMSKGLGLNYVTAAMVNWHNADALRMYCVTLDGKKLSMPRYYKDKIYDETQRAKVHHVALDLIRAQQLKSKISDWSKDQSILHQFRKQSKSKDNGYH